MTKLHNILAGTALAALVALPGFAQTVSLTTDVQAAVSALKDGESNIGTNAGESMNASSEAFVGNTVMSSDGAMIGTVQKAAVNAEGNTIILVDLDQALGAEADSFTLTLAASEKADGQVDLSWSKGDLVAALNNQIDLKTDTNG